MILEPGTRLGPYEISGPLGAGGMGEVYRARDTRLGREVALKVLPEAVGTDRERLARFEREAQVLAALNHPNVGSIYGVEDAGGKPALVLELVEGPTLADRIARGPMQLEEALPIARQIAEALEYAHDHGVVHRDLKPANVKLDAEGRAKVLDFGLAKAIAGDPAAGHSDPSFSPTITSLGTVAGVMLGTAAYMSPEQARGRAVDRRADIWAFGAVLWEMLTGRRAFDGETVSDTLASVLRAPLEWGSLPAELPPTVVRLLRRCLERDPRRRLRDIGEARIALETLGEEPEPSPGARSASAWTPPRRWLVVLPWVLLALTASGLAATLWLASRTAEPASVTRFEIGPPPGLANVTWPRLSPDGRILAFLLPDESGSSSIWIRPLEAFTAHPLAGTENAGRPFWSPDGRYLAFFRGDQLVKVPVAGGPAQLICEAANGSDGSWGTGGVILFDGRPTDPIRRCSASGGVPSEETRPDHESGEAVRAWPFFLPDGRHYLFIVQSAGEVSDGTTIHVAALGESGSKMLARSDSRVEYANGHLIYILQDTLVAQEFDPETLTTSGDPVPVASGVSAQPPGHFSVSPNGVLAYRAAGESGDSRLVWVDRSGRETGSVGEPDGYRDLALSPDAERLAYSLFDGRSEDVWVRDLRRDVAMRLTSDPANDVWPVWSPDGTRIVFSSDRTGLFGLMAKSASGTGSAEGLLGSEGVNLGATSWSKDGRFLAVSAYPLGGTPDVRILSMDGSGNAVDYLASEAREFGAAFSPDGRWVAYASEETGRNEVYVQPYPASGAKWTISNTGGRDPRWRADGKEIFYRAPDDTIFAVPVTLGATLDAGLPTPLFRVPLQTTGIHRNRWEPTPDGQRFLLNAVIEERSAAPISIVLNWPRSLEAR